MSLFSIFIAQHVSAYLTIIRFIEIDGEIGALLQTVNLVDIFSLFFDLILKSEI
jgi:hypothetical protein